MQWQKIEEETVLSTEEIIAPATSPIPRIISEIIQRDT